MFCYNLVSIYYVKYVEVEQAPYYYNTTNSTSTINSTISCIAIINSTHTSASNQ